MTPDKPKSKIRGRITRARSKVPNATTQAAIRESRASMKEHGARFRDATEMFKALDKEGRKR